MFKPHCLALLACVPAIVQAQHTSSGPESTGLRVFRERSLRTREAQTALAPVAATRSPAPSTSSGGTPHLPVSASSASPAGVHLPAAAVGSCPDSIRDAATLGCIGASSTPTLGMLYPLSSALNVSAAGRVGIGTTTPAHALDLVGDLRGSGRVAFGNDATVGQTGYYGGVFDMSQVMTDFSGHEGWTPLRSYFTLDPAIDLTGINRKYFYSHDLIIMTAATNTHDFEHIEGPYLAAFHQGTGRVGALVGALVAAQSMGGRVDEQVGLYVASFGSDTAQVISNTGIAIGTGHFDSLPGASIQDDYGLYISTPDHVAPIQNHYGIYLEDQVVATGVNYAVYSAGGANYFAGNVGIGTQPTNYALQVGQLGDGSEARANAWNLLSSREYKRDIVALDATEYAGILEKVAKVDVVHYRYANDDHTHLGVIAEDSPKEILSRDGKGVSLGDYSAFLLAGLKAQQEQIQDLKTRLAALEAKLDAQGR